MNAKADTRARDRDFRMVPTWLLLATVVICGGWPDSCSNDNQKAYVALSPLAVVVPREKLWQAAEYYSRLRPGSAVLSGEGEDMMPLYAPGTLLVVEPILYDDLKEGMTAILRDQAGMRAARFLVEKTPKGWTTRRLAAKEPDEQPMAPENYIGVVVMAFTPG